MIQKAIAVLLFVSQIVCAQTLDETAQALGRRVAARIPAGTAVHLTGRNLSSSSNTELAVAQRAIDRALRRRTPRQAPVAEVRLTLSENPREFLLIVEVRRDGERAVEMASYRPPAVVTANLPSLERRLLWEQDRPILDVLPAQDRLIVLDPEKVTVYMRRSGVWEPASTRDLDMPGVRDPRGRLLLDGENLRVLAPGASCRGAWQPALDLNCENQPGEFEGGPGPAHFTPARNSLETDGWPVFYAYARLSTAARPLHLLSGLDGRAHLYNQDQRPLAVIDDWNSDFVSACGGQVLAAKTGPRTGLDLVTAYRIVDGRAVETSEPAELPGGVTAMWPMPGGALVVCRTAPSGRYAAYSLTLDCSR
ncbi:MAG: hypothetical protein J0H49_12425 [Acidobacteria bacterium]|nr:hypothetical protein [Acidobacteriota bacterium]